MNPGAHTLSRPSATNPTRLRALCLPPSYDGTARFENESITRCREETAAAESKDLNSAALSSRDMALILV